MCWCDGLRGHGLYVHRLGILASALLLSLGAPFWFNILKSLSSLRSSVASNISEEKKADQKSGKADKPSNPPPGVMKKAAH